MEVSYAAQRSSSSKNAGPSLRAMSRGGIPPLLDLSVGPAMFFSRRWILCSRSRLGRAACLNCHMPDTNILCSRSRLGRAARLNCHMPDTNILCSRSRLGRAARLNCHMPDTNILCFRSRLGRAARLNCHMPGAKIISIEINIKMCLTDLMGHAIFMWLKNKQSHALTPAQLGDRAFIDMYLLGIL